MEFNRFSRKKMGVVFAPTGHHMRRMKRRYLLAAAAVLLGTVPADAEPVPNRWGLDYNRATRIPRASDNIVPRVPPRVYPKVKKAPKAKIQPLPKYGKPKPAIERIPET